MAKKTGLGRGLDALFSDTIKEPEIEEVTGEIVCSLTATIRYVSKMRRLCI